MKHQIQHVKINNEIFFLKVASTPTELNNGLMYIKDLDDNTGMLFVFPNETRNLSFWMKNTYIPLDLIFINSSGIVVYTYSNAQPFNENGIRCPNLAKFVIETKAGAIDRYDIEPGDKVYFLN